MCPMLAARCLKYRYAVTKVRHVLSELEDDMGFVSYFRVGGRAEADHCPDRAELAPPSPLESYKAITLGQCRKRAQ